MKRTKVYNSRTWLVRKLKQERLSVAEIARLAGCAESTIYAKLKEFGIK